MGEVMRNKNAMRSFVVAPSEEPGNTFRVYEVPDDLVAAQDKCLEVLRSHPNVGQVLPLGHQAVVRRGSGDFEVGEYVVHLGTLEPAEILRLGWVSWVSRQGRFPFVELEDAGPLFKKPPAQCGVCHLPFLSTEIRHGYTRPDVEILYCEKCRLILSDIAKRVSE